MGGTGLTVIEALAMLRTRGYQQDFSVSADAALQCAACGDRHPPEQAVVEHALRTEGDSNPDDEAVVYGLRCTHCGATGTLVSAYGPSASTAEAAVMTALAHRSTA